MKSPAIFWVIAFVGLSCLAQAQLDKVTLPEGNYPYWPVYNYITDAELYTIREKAWNNSDHILEGWDWSMPGFVNPSPRSSLGLQRIYGTDKPFLNFNLQFKANPVGLLWVNWREIEKTMDNFDFDPLISRLKQAQSIGTKVSLRILCHAKARGTGKDSINRAEAPLWLDDLGCSLLPQKDPKNNLNYDPAHPEFHKRYLKLINEIAKTEIPALVKNMYIGYASASFGDEGIGPYGEGNSFANDTVKHVRERLDAWENAFNGMETKIYMGGACDYGFRKGFGARRGFVEMYHYNIPNYDLGSYVDDKGYLKVDENAPLIKYKCFNGEVNEEYSADMAASKYDYRFGISTKSFPYRYFMSMLRTLQMQCTYVHDDGRLIPEMMPFISMELGRTVENAPDVWSFLNTFYLRKSNYSNNDWRGRMFTQLENSEGIEAKNYERWLYQRDAAGYETTPELPIQQAVKMWMIQPDRYYDYMARSGKKIGFDVDNRWGSINDTIALKVSYFDNYAGQLNVVYSNGTLQSKKVADLVGDRKLKTATLFIPKLVVNSLANDFDFVLEAGSNTEKIVVSMVRVVRAATGKVNISTSASHGSITFSPSGGSYTLGTSVKVKAIPAVGYKFSSWGGDLSGTVDSAAIVMNSDKSINANFSLISPENNVSLAGSWVQGTSHVKETGSNRALVVMLYGEGSGDISAVSVTYGGQTMTRVVEKSYLSGSYSYTGAFVLNEAGVAAATSGTINVAWSSAPGTGFDVTSAFFSNVDQSSPIGATASNGLVGTTITTSALPNNAGDMVLVAGTAATGGTYTINNGYTRGIGETTASFGDITSAYKLASGTAETPGLTTASSMRQTIIGFVLKKAVLLSGITRAVQNSFRIYPNPVSNLLNIDFPNAETSREINVFHLSGQLMVRVHTKEASVKIDVQALKLKGIVLVQVVADKTVSTHKVLIE